MPFEREVSGLMSAACRKEGRKSMNVVVRFVQGYGLTRACSTLGTVVLMYFRGQGGVVFTVCIRWHMDGSSWLCHSSV